MSLNADIFNLSVSEDLINDSGSSAKESIIYKLNAKDGKNNTANAVIKLIPDIHDPNKLWVNKWTVWLTNPATEEKRMIDCPSTLKQPSILQDCFFALRKSNNASEKALETYFKRKEAYFSLCDIIQDPQKPENEGHIKVFRYGQKVFEKIKNLMFPENDLVEKNIPFDLFNGKPLMLKVKLVSDFNNYDDSIFLDKVLPITIVKFDESGQPSRNSENKVVRQKVEPKQQNFKLIEEYLRERTPAPLADYAFKPWDQEIWDYVTDAIQNILPNQRMIDTLFKKYNITGQQFSGNTTPTKKRTSQTNIDTISLSPKIDMDDTEISNFEEDEIDNIIKSTTSSKKDKPKTTESTTKTKKKIDIDDDFDDIDLGEFDDDDTNSDYDDL